MHFQIILSIFLICGYSQINAKPLDDREFAEKLLNIAEDATNLAHRLEARLEKCEAISLPPTTPDPTRPPTTPEPTRPPPSMEPTTPEPTRPPATSRNLQPLFLFDESRNSIVSPLGD
ncbi:actin cytoskeleton-regulatory complex protein pan1-like [Chelonus insularis]|uniref:actin cytoskeleton-regulatory complex protein pan1-like n=1 Tax=Chelonus insularis TaxID=460826 RepID=UPI00158BD9CF|nr:actin cytoskeleton-regulatory complex protein pan1-like [Chelonus insularis]